MRTSKTNSLKRCPFCDRRPVLWPGPGFHGIDWNITCAPCKYTITRENRDEVINLYEENWQLFHKDEETSKSFADAGYTAVELGAILTHDDR